MITSLGQIIFGFKVTSHNELFELLIYSNKISINIYTQN
jgi:hypothetical protein